MMARSEKRVEEIRKKISALKGEPLPTDVLQTNAGVVAPGRAARIFNAAKKIPGNLLKKQLEH